MLVAKCSPVGLSLACVECATIEDDLASWAVKNSAHTAADFEPPSTGFIGVLIGGWIGTQLGWGYLAEWGIRTMGLATLGAIGVMPVLRLALAEQPGDEVRPIVTAMPPVPQPQPHARLQGRKVGEVRSCTIKGINFCW